MIYILDNGESWSDHEVCFVEFPSKDWSVKNAEALIEKCGSWSVLAVVERLDWRELNSLKTPSRFAPLPSHNFARGVELLNALSSNRGKLTLLRGWAADFDADEKSYEGDYFDQFEKGKAWCRKKIEEIEKGE